VGHDEPVGDRTAVTTPGLPEPERRSGPSAVHRAGSERAATAGVARSARDLEADEHPIPGAVARHLRPHRDHLGDDLMPDRERPREDSERRHRQVKIAAGHGQRTHDRGARILADEIGDLLPGDVSGVVEDELAHRPQAASASRSRSPANMIRIVTASKRSAPHCTIAGTRRPIARLMRSRMCSRLV